MVNATHKMEASTSVATASMELTVREENILRYMAVYMVIKTRAVNTLP